LKDRYRQRAWQAGKKISLAKAEPGAADDTRRKKLGRLLAEQDASRVVVQMLNRSILNDGSGMVQGSKSHSDYISSIEELRKVLIGVSKLKEVALTEALPELSDIGSDYSAEYSDD